MESKRTQTIKTAKGTEITLAAAEHGQVTASLILGGREVSGLITVRNGDVLIPSLGLNLGWEVCSTVQIFAQGVQADYDAERQALRTKEQAYDNLYNEGAEGFNPYRHR